MKNKGRISVAVLLVSASFGILQEPMLSQTDMPPGSSRAPQLSLSAELEFAFQKMKDFPGVKVPLPTDPNTWTIRTEIKNTDTELIEVLPLYLFSESHAKEGKILENAHAISPEMYKECFPDRAAFGVTYVPRDLKGQVTEDYAMPLSQLSEPLQGKMGAYIGAMDFQSALVLDGKNTYWGNMEIPPKSCLSCTWQFWNEWAASAETRTTKGFLMQLIGPVFRRGSGEDRNVFVAVTTFQPVSSTNGTRWITSTLEFKEVNEELATEVTKKQERPSVEEFIKAVDKAARK